ncbi:MAG: type II toxin-antitoxin system HicA family toxin [Oscillibacter sp.]|nr:type II toxin-antitoxin system HicA family toxin [Oscillibacter sp.]
MKTTELLKTFIRKGWWVLREGGSHTIMTNGTDTEPIPRHKEVSEQLAKAIIRRRNL